MSSATDMTNIKRYTKSKYSNNSNGYYVQIERKWAGARIQVGSKFFSDTESGNKSKALEDAIAFRDKVETKFPPFCFADPRPCFTGRKEGDRIKKVS